MKLYPESIQKFDQIEYHPCKEFTGTDSFEKFVEQCEPEEAEFWSVYGHLPGGGLSCIADVDTEQEAKEFAEFLQKIIHDQV